MAKYKLKIMASFHILHVCSALLCSPFRSSKYFCCNWWKQFPISVSAMWFCCWITRILRSLTKKKIIFYSSNHPNRKEGLDNIRIFIALGLYFFGILIFLHYTQCSHDVSTLKCYRYQNNCTFWRKFALSSEHAFCGIWGYCFKLRYHIAQLTVFTWHLNILKSL